MFSQLPSWMESTATGGRGPRNFRLDRLRGLPAGGRAEGGGHGRTPPVQSTVVRKVRVAVRSLWCESVTGVRWYVSRFLAAFGRCTSHPQSSSAVIWFSPVRCAGGVRPGGPALPAQRAPERRGAHAPRERLCARECSGVRRAAGEGAFGSSYFAMGVLGRWYCYSMRLE